MKWRKKKAGDVEATITNGTRPINFDAFKLRFVRQFQVIKRRINQIVDFLCFFIDDC